MLTCLVLCTLLSHMRTFLAPTIPHGMTPSTTGLITELGLLPHFAISLCEQTQQQAPIRCCQAAQGCPKQSESRHRVHTFAPTTHAFRNTRRPLSALCFAVNVRLRYSQSAPLTGVAEPAKLDVQLCAATFGDQ